MGRLNRPICLLMLAALAGGCTTGTGALDGVSPGADAGGIGAQGNQNVAALTTEARVHFAPVIGATEEALAPLSTRLRERAAQRGLTVEPQEGGASYVMKGYFSAFTDGGDTTVIYVWDVLDASGSRLHRIQGRENVPAGSADGWASVTPATMEAIADKSVDELTTWLSRQQA